MVKKEWPKFLPLALSLFLALATVAASWGASKANAASSQKQLEQVQTQVKDLEQLVGGLDKGSAVNEVVLRNIAEQLKSINKKLEELDKKFDKFRDKE
jgi:septal ring factor EnvC (AmiA/AmiB activator)